MEKCYCFKDGNLTAEQIVDRIDTVLADIEETLFWINKGTGWCATFVQHFTNAPKTEKWRQGSKVWGNLHIRPGTAIATFNAAGRYPGKDTGNHAAIYLGLNPRGIDVYHQTTSLGPFPRRGTLRLDREGVLNAHSYSVVTDNYIFENVWGINEQKPHFLNMMKNYYK